MYLSEEFKREGAKDVKERQEKQMKYGESTSAEIERVARIIVDAAFKVHTTLGPGLLESVYAICLRHELRKRGLRVDPEVMLPITYDGIRLESPLRIDLLVESIIIVETKAVEKVNPLYGTQLLTYLKLSGLPLGFLINFNVTLIKDGIKRVIRTG